MKKVLLKLKEWVLTPFNPKHEKVIYSVCITSIVFMALIVWMSFSNTSDKLKLLKDNVGLQLEMKDLDHTITEQNNFIDEVSSILKQQSDHIQKSEDLLNLQQNLIQRLIQKLRELDEWPPKDPPYDPDKIAIIYKQSHETEKNIQENRTSSQVVVRRETAN